MADRIVVMRDGRIEQQGAPLDIYDRPANIFVAGFIGSPAMSFLRGQVAGGTLTVGAQKIAVSAPDGTVIVGVRPEGFVRVQDGTGIEVEVRVIEPMGPETHVLANLVDDALVYERAADTASDIRAVLRSRVKFAPPERQILSLDPDAIHLFDPETSARID